MGKKKKMKKEIEMLKLELRATKAINSILINDKVDKAKKHIKDASEVAKEKIDKAVDQVQNSNIGSTVYKKINDITDKVFEAKQEEADEPLPSIKINTLYRTIPTREDLAPDDSEEGEDYVDYAKRLNKGKPLTVDLPDIPDEYFHRYIKFCDNHDLLLGFIINDSLTAVSKLKGIDAIDNPVDNDIHYILIGNRIFFRVASGSGFSYYDLMSGLPYKSFYENLEYLIPDEEERSYFKADINSCTCKIMYFQSITELQDYTVN